LVSAKKKESQDGLNEAINDYYLLDTVTQKISKLANPHSV
jgi:hypothetical protein